MSHTLKSLRAEFKAQGKFHTPPELALFLRGLIPGDPCTVYDPTCGAGSLLAEFPDSTQKFGQDIDAAALADASLLPNFHGHLGDVLTSPAWLDRRFSAIVANPPFSVKWAPATATDERFFGVPTIPTQGRADYAFLIHILHMLTDDGVAAVLQFPGILYRGGREGVLRRWMVESNFIDQVIHIPGDTFTDTAISTVCLVLRKDRGPSAPIRFVDREHDLERDVPLAEIADHGWTLSIGAYLSPPVDQGPPVDPWALEMQARSHTCRELKKDIRFSMMVAEIEGWPMGPFLDDLAAVIDAHREVSV